MSLRALTVILRVVVWIVPAASRDRWREEWLAEIHQVARDRGARTAARLALGAAADAWSLRRLARERRRQPDDRKGPVTIGFSPTDVKLAVRMLIRYPGLTLVGVLGMAVGITIAAGAFTIISAMMNPALPFQEGDHIVVIGNWDVRTNNMEPRVLHDFATWRTELRSVEDIGAVRTISRNLIAPGAPPQTVPVAEISASAFRVTRVEPLIGRPLLVQDEHAGGPDVVVIGDDVWRRRFGADPGVLGREIQLGSRIHTIVGVMPPGFRFPEAHSFWIPLRTGVSYEPVTGAAVTVFARLAHGVTLDAAQAEVAAIGARIAVASPKTHEHLRARVVPYTYAFNDMSDPGAALTMRLIQTMIVLLLVVVCMNVAILIYARTATRQGEIAVRSALGASRGRIVGQLFVEALALSGVAAVVAVGLLAVGLSQLEAALEQLASGVPFWLKFELSRQVMIYIAALGVFSAAIVGVAPALKATGRQLQSGMQCLSAGSGARMQMGRLWTLLIVAQVGTAVALLPATVYYAWVAVSFRAGTTGFASHEFLAADLLMERAADVATTTEAERQFRTNYSNRLMELERQLEADAGVSHVTFSLMEPGEELAAVVEVEGAANPATAVDYTIVEGRRQGHLLRFNRVAIDFFDAFEVPLLTGRAFHTGDAGPAGGVIVDRTFIDRFFGSQNPLGRRIRYVGRSREAGEGNIELGRWQEIVGIVSDFPPQPAGGEPRTPRIYHAASANDVYPASLAVRVRGPAAAFSDRVREIGARVDPALQLRNLSTLEEARRREQGLMRLIGASLFGVVVSVIALSAAGIYALISFTVARRRKEIGIRAALGADPKRILTGVFSRVFRQLAGGALIGVAGAVALEGALEGGMFQGRRAVALPLVIVLMTLVGLLAAAGPARRGLRIHPTEALREE